MIKSFLIFVFFVLFIVSLLIYLFQRQLIYFPSREIPNRSLFQAEDMQEISLPTTDGLKLLAWFKPAFPNKPTLLYLHGNAGHIGHRMTLIRQLLSTGFGVFLLEYRGYGGNKGKPSEQGLYIDARSAVHFLEQQGVPPQHLVVYGESLGTGVAVKMASEFQICALILQSPFSSLSAVARYHYPWIFIRPSDKFNSLALIDIIKAPLLILHGKSDPVVPFDQGLELYNQAIEPKKMIAFDNKGHNNLWDYQFAFEIINFIHSNCS
ncbi:MAG: alpha/beta fold hydrolase [Tatlockia sp.]|nr:alpha/beta fold hydrolase [Tatlockia sp.]